MDILKAILAALNGKKLNTGTIIILAALVMQKLFGIGNDEATSIATSVMMGVGGVFALWGYIHRLIKTKTEKTPEPAK